jgi:hypothetical protein
MYTDLIYHPTMGDYVLPGCRVYVKDTVPRYALRGTVVERLDAFHVIVAWDFLDPADNLRTEVTGTTGAIGPLPDRGEA